MLSATSILNNSYVAVVKNDDENIPKIESESMVLEAIAHHFTNPFCARTNNGKVMYEKEIMNLINSVEIL